VISKEELIKWGLIVVTAFVAVTTIAFFAGRGCAPDPVILKDVPTDVDTSEVDTEADRELNEAEKETERKILELEEHHREELNQFSEEQEREYRDIREQGPDAVVDWLRDFNKQLEEEKTCSEPF
jgi:hypothetical protein